MFSSLGCLLLCGSVALALGNAQKLPKGKRPDLKVHINTTGDSVFLKFLRPNPNVKLEGFLLGYGSNVSPNQYFPLPTDGKYTEAVVDAEPKYLIVVRPAPPPSQKKSCSGKSRPRKPLQLVVGTLTPSSVFLSWGFLINPQHDWTLPSHCPNDRYYTIRYREKDKEKKWVFQLCPATETIVENLKPNTVYEFGVKDNVEGGIWSKIFNHKTIVRSKNKVNGKIQSTYDQVHTVPAYVPRRIIPVTIIKQVIQNITHRASTKSPDRTPFGGTILLHLVIPGLNETTVKLPTSLIFEISDALKTQLATNETLALPAESKTPQVEKIPAQPITVLSERTSETPQTVLIPRFELPLSTLAPKRLPEFPQAKTPFPFEKPGGTLASSEKLWIVPTSKTPEDSKVLPPQTATYDVFSRPATPDEREIAEPHTATPKTKRPGRRPRPKATRRPDVPKSKPALEPATVQPELLVPTVASKPSKRPKTTRRPAVPQIQPDSIPPKQLLPKPKSTAKPDMPPTTSVFEPVTFGTETPSLTIVLATDEPVTPRTEAPWTTLAPKSPQRTRPRRPRPKHKTTPSPEAPQTKIDFTPVTPGTSLAPKKPTKRPRRPRPKPKTTPHPEVPQIKLVPATIFEPVTLRTEAPGTTLAPKVPQRPRLPRPKPKTTPRPEAPQTELVTPIKEAPGTTFVPVTDREPITLRTETFGTTLATKTSQRPRRPRPRPKTTRRPQVPPSKPVPATILEPVTVKPKALGTTLVLTPDLETVTFRTETWVTTQAPKTSKRTRRPRPKPKTTPTPEAPQTKLVPTKDLEPGILRTEAPEIMVHPTVLEPVTLRTKAPETTLAPTELQTLILEPVTSPSLEMTQSQPVVESITPVSEPPESTLAPKQIPRTPPKPKTPPRPRIPETQPAPKVPQRVTPRPKTFPSPEVSYTLPVPKDVLLPHKPDPEVSESESVLQPVTFRIHPPETTIAPLETRGSPFIPMISPSPSREELQTLAETDQSTQEPITTKIPQSTELAKTTRAPHRLYTTPVRPRLPDRPHIRPGVKQTPKPPGAVSVDSTHVTKKPATVPGTRRPPLPPRPSPPRRKPLPPNNVTGKPGSAGIVPSGRATSPPLRATLRPTEGPSERIEADKKQPTVPASGEDLGNTTDFSSSPTRETDPLGKPRFKGPHVRYIPKPDNRPCSITDSVKRFPKEEATEGNATSPPQNPPTNLTVVTVEGCPSFVILDWDKPLNDTVTEYEVISRENGSFSGKNKSIHTNQTFSTVENLKPDTSYEFQVKSKNPLGEGPASNTVAFSTESADPRVSEPIYAGRDAIWTERPFNSDSYSECKGKQYVKRTWYKKFVGVQLCNSLRYKIYLSDSLTGKFYNIGDQRGHGEDHCQFVDSFLDGRTGQQLTSDQLPTKEGYFRAVRQEPVQFGEIGGHTQINYVQWYECGTTIPGKW
ncbi:target of Nesh-SH3 isoform X25 [Manis pentadactyla]|uniref:target of Nesh-SH3 isoform X25 n=1 Tax=Manis pentadactyla TaxID=143292 RepID=UPI00255C7FB0|nr:target of Nesh-SH3 isoform X25 [Manis pentadactyla]